MGVGGRILNFNIFLEVGEISAFFILWWWWVGDGGAGYWPFEGIFGVTFKTDYFWGSIKILGILWGVGYCKNRG